LEVRTNHSNEEIYGRRTGGRTELYIYAEVLHQYEANAIDNIILGGYGAMDSQAPDAKDGYYLIRWTGTPYLLTAPNANVQGCDGVMPAGTFVCKGRYLTRLNRAPHWYYYDALQVTSLYLSPTVHRCSQH
jgi:hypothetical protein